MISRVLLQNWKSHESSDMQFSKGTNVLVGRSGSGKSSVLDGVCFALFGTFPSLQARKLKLEDCVKNKPAQCESANVKVWFDVGDGEYCVSRDVVIGKGSTKCELRKGEELIEAPNAQRVSEAVQKVLRVDYELFSRAVYAEQNQIDYFLQIPSGQRKKKIDELLRIDRFEKARKTLTTVKNRLSAKKEDKKKAVEDALKAGSLEKLEEMKTALENAEKENEQKREELGKKRGKLEKIVKDVEALEKKEQEYRTLEKAIAEASAGKKSGEARASELKKELGELLEKDVGEELAKGRAEFEAKKAQHEENVKVIGELKTQAATLKAEFSGLDKEVEEHLKSMKTAQEEHSGLAGGKPKESLEEAKKRESELGVDIADRKAEIRAHEERLKKLNRVKKACPVCESELGEERRVELIGASEQFIKSTVDEVNGKERILIELGVEELAKKLARFEALEEKLKELGTLNVEEKEKKRQEALDELNKIQKQLEEKESKVTADEEGVEKLRAGVVEKEKLLEKQQEFVRLSESVGKLVEECEGLQKKIEENAFDESTLKTARGEKEESAVKVQRLEAEVNAAKSLMEEKKNVIAEVEKRKALVEEWENEVIGIAATEEKLVKFKTALESTQGQLRNEFTFSVNTALEDVWQRIYPYEDYDSVRLGVDGGDYALQLRTKGGEWVGAEGIVSGGERSTACLALRIAFSLVLTQNLSWLVLDEPTHNLDSDGVLGLAKTLKTHLPGLVEQIFVITHDEGMEKAGGKLYKFERKKELDEATRVLLVSEE